ncbi:MAG: alpha-L-fucosidase [bacterium]
MRLGFAGMICALAACLLTFGTMADNNMQDFIFSETPEQRDARMTWWREARFGMFIHWGLYSVAAGEWNGKAVKGLSSWTLNEIKVPFDEYAPLKNIFNPVCFKADEWVRLAKNAGMKYIVITTKHHEGFCLFDSQFTEFDIISTPFHIDIMRELVDACRKEGIKIGWYHSILDWSHPDYLPRRPGDDRSTENADYERFVVYLKNQIREILTNYGPIDVMWFDGEWDETWTYRHGRDLYAYVRGLQPNIIVNNRVDKGRVGMAGLTKEGDYAGDFGTPEQEMPLTGLPGVDWETCMTMNDTWGYKKNDHNWKSETTLIQMLVDCASKGGNFLLNVGPTALGEIPQPSIARLEAIGRWMATNSESIYGTQATPFKQTPWGRCTQKKLEDEATRLYLHVFDWPDDGKIVVKGLNNTIRQAYLLSDPDHASLKITSERNSLTIRVPETAPDTIDTVVAVDIEGVPDVVE